MSNTFSVNDYARAQADKFGIDSNNPRIVAAIVQAYFDGVHDTIDR